MPAPDPPPGGSPLWTLGYVSVALHIPTAAELRDVLHASQRNNPVHGVTGLLVHCAGTFMQVLEGPPDGVNEIFRRIRANPLHTEIQVFFDEPLDRREFGEWSMLCRQAAADQIEPVLRAPSGTKRHLIYSYWRAWQ